MCDGTMRRLFLPAVFIALLIFCAPPATGAQETVGGIPHAAPLGDDKTAPVHQEKKTGEKDLPADAAGDAIPADSLKEIRESLRSLRERQADIGADMTALADQVRKIRGELEAFNNPERLKMDRLEMQSALDDLSARMRVIENLTGAGDLKSSAKPPKAETAPAAPPDAAKTGKPDVKEIYTDAFKDFKDGEYERSRGKFEAFLKAFPDVSLASGAQFWIGESYYMEGNIERAIIEYDKVIKNYPKGEMIPHALLKQGLSFQKIGDKTGARILLEKLVDEFPDSHQAKLAASTLATLK